MIVFILLVFWFVVFFKLTFDATPLWDSPGKDILVLGRGNTLKCATVYMQTYSLLRILSNKLVA